jgi:hypothetical protein
MSDHSVATSVTKTTTTSDSTKESVTLNNITVDMNTPDDTFHNIAKNTIKLLKITTQICYNMALTPIEENYKPRVLDYLTLAGKLLSCIAFTTTGESIVSDIHTIGSLPNYCNAIDNCLFNTMYTMSAIERVIEKCIASNASKTNIIVNSIFIASACESIMLSYIATNKYNQKVCELVQTVVFYILFKTSYRHGLRYRKTVGNKKYVYLCPHILEIKRTTSSLRVTDIHDFIIRRTMKIAMMSLIVAVSIGSNGKLNKELIRNICSKSLHSSQVIESLHELLDILKMAFFGKFEGYSRFTYGVVCSYTYCSMMFFDMCTKHLGVQINPERYNIRQNAIVMAQHRVGHSEEEHDVAQTMISLSDSESSDDNKRRKI